MRIVVDLDGDSLTGIACSRIVFVAQAENERAHGATAARGWLIEGLRAMLGHGDPEALARLEASRVRAGTGRRNDAGVGQLRTGCGGGNR